MKQPLPLGAHGGAHERRSPRDAAMIAEVLQALEARLRQAADSSPGDEAATPLEPELEDLIASALGELGRMTRPDERGGVAPVLGSGVLQGLLRQRRQQLAAPAVSAEDHAIDERR